MRSRIRTPSRWSISCWITRASRPSASTSSSARRAASCARTRTRRALDLDVDAREAQAALLGGLELLAGATRCTGLTSAVDRLVGVGAIDEQRGAARRAGSPRGRRRARRASARPCARPRRAAPSSKRSTGDRAGAQHRIAELAHWRSAASRRARVSGSSSSASGSCRAVDLVVGARRSAWPSSPARRLALARWRAAGVSAASLVAHAAQSSRGRASPAPTAGRRRR